MGLVGPVAVAAGPVAELNPSPVWVLRMKVVAATWNSRRRILPVMGDMVPPKMAGKSIAKGTDKKTLSVLHASSVPLRGMLPALASGRASSGASPHEGLKGVDCRD